MGTSSRSRYSVSSISTFTPVSAIFPGKCSNAALTIDAKRNSWQVDNHGVNREALIKAYDVLVKSPEDRKKLEITAPMLVAARDKAVVEQKRERLQQELATRSARQSNSLRI